MPDIIKHQRAFLYAAVDGGIHFWGNLTTRGANLGIGIQINFVYHNRFGAHFLKFCRQSLSTIHKIAIIIREKGDRVAPRSHGGFIFRNITLDFVHHLRGLLQSLNGETPNANIRQRGIDVAFGYIHAAEIIVRHKGFLHIERGHCFVGRYEINDAIAVFIVV